VLSLILSVQFIIFPNKQEIILEKHEKYFTFFNIFLKNN